MATNSDEVAVSQMPKQQLPDELIVEDILCRLPIGSIYEFKQVSKTLCSQIVMSCSKPQFARRQLNKSCIVKNNNIYGRQRVVIRGRWTYDLLKVRGSTGILRSEKTKWIPHQMRDTNGPSDRRRRYKLNPYLGSCCGLVCILSDKYANKVLFWNPLTRESKEVEDPQNITEFEFGSFKFVYGLGYNSTTDDCSLVRIGWVLGGDQSNKYSDVQIYSLTTHCWRPIQGGLPYPYFYSQDYGVFLNGSLHWIAEVSMESPSIEDKIVRFNLAEEKFDLLDIPHVGYTRSSLRIGVLGEDKLCVCYMCLPNDEFTQDLWLMNEYGKFESWEKHTINTNSSQTWIPLCLLNNGEEVLFGEHVFFGDLASYKLSLYNLKHGTFKDFPVPDMPVDNLSFFGAITITESLISPSRFNGIKLLN